MQVKIFASLVLLAATLASTKPTGANSPTDKQIQELSRTPFSPPYQNPDPTSKDNTGWAYPPEAIVRIPRNRQGQCNFDVIMDGSRCAGMQGKQEVVVAPYDEYSMNMLEGNMEFQTGIKDGKPYAQRTFHLNKCGFNGRFFLMDQARDNLFDTSRMSIRVVLEQGKLQSWITAEKDEETGIKQSRNAPLIHWFTEDDTDAHKERIFGDEHMRGMANSTRIYKKTSDNYMYIQFC